MILFVDLSQFFIPEPAVVVEIAHRREPIRYILVYSHRAQTVLASCRYVRRSGVSANRSGYSEHMTRLWLRDVPFIRCSLQ